VPKPLPWLAVLAIATLACGGKPKTPIPVAGSPPPREPIKPLITTPFAGQQIAVVPITLVVGIDTLATVAPLSNHQQAVAWADSLVGLALETRRPEVKWALPPELRKIARRSPTVAPDPDRMGQSLMRANSIDDVPEPLQSSLRSLVAMLNGRFALIPAAITFVPEQSGVVRSEVSMVLADSRTGKVVWRTVAWGLGATPTRALIAAMENVLPL
jgi:hypothetical protein